MKRPPRGRSLVHSGRTKPATLWARHHHHEGADHGVVHAIFLSSRAVSNKRALRPGMVLLPCHGAVADQTACRYAAGVGKGRLGLV